MKVVGWILFVLSILAIPLMAILCATGVFEDTMTQDIILGVVFFFILGSLGHLCVINKMDEDTATKVLYYASFPAFIVLFVIIWIVKKIFKLITRSGSSSNSSGGKGKTVYTVQDGGWTRDLVMIESYKYDADTDSPLFGQHYDKFVDDLGNYWRSYDNGATFVKETFEQQCDGRKH